MHQVSAWWPFTSVVLTVHFQSRDYVMCKNPPPPLDRWRDYLSLVLRAWTSDTVTLSHGPVIGYFDCHSSTSSSTTTSSPSATSRLERRVSVFLFWPFASLCFQSELPLALCSFVNCCESSPLFGLWPSRLAASVVAHWSGNRTVPWPLVWDSWPPLSYALYRTSLPRLIIARTIWSERTRSRWSPWLEAECPLSAQ